MKRPSLRAAKRAFREVYEDVGKAVSGVGVKIGGKVDYNINHVPVGQGRFENACAIRLSHVLNQTGFLVPRIAGETVSGGAGKWYIYRVTTMIQHLHSLFGKPDIQIRLPTAHQLGENKSLLMFYVDQWVDASGHATIWDGTDCADKCYYPQANRAILWNLKD